jgi:lysozyme
MSDLLHAVDIIRYYEGFNETSYPDPETGAEPYTIGYGTQFYPDGSPVKKGQRCTKEKALEHLVHEIGVIDTQLTVLNLGLDYSMRQALVSFIHSIGWDPFLYSQIVDCIEDENWLGATNEINRWIFDGNHHVIAALINRRKAESLLFLNEIKHSICPCTDILVKAFRNYSAAPHQIKAIRALEDKINPYTLSEFANNFRVDQDPWGEFTDLDANVVFDSWS